MLLLAVFGVVLIAGCSEAPRVSTGPGAGHAEGPVRLTDVTGDAGLGGFRHENGGAGQKWMPEIVGSGAAFMDYDDDGWQDILLVGGGTWSTDAVPALRLYRNDGDGSFTERTREAGLAGVQAYGFGLAVADYDNDGDEDVFLSTLEHSLLFQNDRGVFKDVSEASGIGAMSRWATSAMFFDADKDGYVDLFVDSYVYWTPQTDIFCSFEGKKGYCTPQAYRGMAPVFYHNNGDGTFSDWTERAGFLRGMEPQKAKALGVAELDYNNDGWPDVMVTVDTERNLLYENQGDGTFKEIGVNRGVAFDLAGRARAGMGVDVGVVDSSGRSAIFVGNFSSETVSAFQDVGSGLFVDRAAAARLGQSTMNTLTFGLLLFDLDLDTDLDLLLANGHVQEHIAKLTQGVSFEEKPQLFLNRGDGIFDEVKQESGPLSVPMVARGAAYADYDRDGDLDMLITENGGPAHLWRNDLQGGRFLRVRLRGSESNRDGIDARVLAWVGGLQMERRVRTGSSYLSQSEKVVTFGLGSHAGVDTLVVEWPSGKVERFEGVEGNEEVLVVEGSGRLEQVPMATAAAGRALADAQ